VIRVDFDLRRYRCKRVSRGELLIFRRPVYTCCDRSRGQAHDCGMNHVIEACEKHVLSGLAKEISRETGDES